MRSIELLRELKSMGFHLTIVELETGIKYQRLHRCINGITELKETDYINLLHYSKSKGVRHKTFAPFDHDTFYAVSAKQRNEDEDSFSCPECDGSQILKLTNTHMYCEVCDYVQDWIWSNEL